MKGACRAVFSEAVAPLRILLCMCASCPVHVIKAGRDAFKEKVI